MVRIALGLALIALAAPAQAERYEDSTLGNAINTPITGAFGFSFGDSFTPTPGAQGERTADGDRFYTVPPQPFPSFNLYLVYLTPSTGRIWGIGASRILESEAACMAEMGLVEEKLDGKYGFSLRIGEPTRYTRTLRWRHTSEPHILLRCSFKILTVLYIDPEVRGLARQEMAVLRDQVDDKGL